MNDHIKAGAKFFMQINIGNSDGTIDLGMEAMEGDEDIQSVIDEAITDVEEHGGDCYIYECRAVRKITRPKVRVTIIKLKR